MFEEDNIDEKTLGKSHRNNQAICDYSNLLYPNDEKAESCSCKECNKENEHEGIYLIREEHVDVYLERYEPIQLIWSSKTKVNKSYPYLNFGNAKGRTYDRVIIYPTKGMVKWMKNNTFKLSYTTRAKFYVALTRAKYSVAIIYNYGESETIPGIEKRFKP